MKKVRIILLILLASFQGYAQGKAVISGRVIEQSSQSPLALVNVVLTGEQDGAIRNGAITDQDGRFEFQGIPQGSYVLSFSFLGYQAKTLPILIGKLNTAFDVGKIELQDVSENLSEVLITAKKSLVNSRLDKKSFNIKENLSQAGGSVLDAMRNLPSVTIDPKGKVLLRGSDKVTILIDGEQSSLTGFGNQKDLDNIPASNIERIEIINNPSAKYDSRGLAGIVNIIYKKENQFGFNGDVSLNLGLGEWTKRKTSLPNIMTKYAFTPKLNPAININYRSKKVNFFLQSDAMIRSKVNANEFTTRTYTNGNPNVNSQFLENRTQQLYDIKAGLDWFIDARNKLTFYALFEDEYHIDRGDVPYDYATNGTRKRLWTWREDENTRFINYAANYLHNFKETGHTLALGVLYTKGGEDEVFSFTDTSADRQGTDLTHLLVDEIVTNIKIDYVKPLRSGRAELGGKVQLRKIPISYTIKPGQNSILDPDLGQWSLYKEDVYALYANWIYERKHFDIEGGMRTEYTRINYDIDPANNYYTKNDAYDYFELFPNIRITFKPDSKHRISAFYNRRIDRPGEFELRPFPKYDDPEILKTGNPYLRPQFTQNFELAYKMRWKKGSAYVAGFYRLLDALFERVYTDDERAPTTVINTIPQNLGKGTNVGFELILDQEITKQWHVNGSFNWYANTINAFSGENLYPYVQKFSFKESKNDTWNMKLNTHFEWLHQMNFQLSAVYYAPNIIPQGKIKERYSIDFGVKKKIMKNKAEINLSATDLFNTFGIRKAITGDGFQLQSENYYETQVVTLGVKYKF